MKKKVLWFSGTSGLYKEDKQKKITVPNGTEMVKNKFDINGGGWISSLQQEIMRFHSHDIELELAFPWSVNFDDECNSVKYHGIKRMKRACLFYKKKQREELHRIKEIIDKSNPDIIHVFGTELSLGLVCTITDIPVVIHIQGVLSTCYDFWLPANISWTEYFLRNPRYIFSAMSLKKFIKREQLMLSQCKYLVGRTEWDKTTVSLLAPQAKYFYCSEMLRPTIYYSEKIWSPRQSKKKTIASVISSLTYKGGDTILCTAQKLEQFTDIEFEWYVYGVFDLKLWSKLTGINPKEVNVRAMGIVNVEDLKEALLKSDIYVHPSYIENSSNAVCESQLLGVPVIATNVGGMSSLIEDKVNGFLVPSRDANMLAARIKEVTSDKELALRISQNGRLCALERHKPENIINDLLSIYKRITNISNC